MIAVFEWLLEALRLRVKDLDFEPGEITVREGKGDKERASRAAITSMNRSCRRRFTRPVRKAGLTKRVTSLTFRHSFATRPTNTSLTDSTMPLVGLGFFDFLIIAVLIMLFAGGTTIASRRAASNAAAGERLRRMEEKLNLLLAHNGIDYVPRTKEHWQRLAESGDKANAAKEYSDTQSVPLEEAEDVVNQYLADISEAI